MDKNVPTPQQLLAFGLSLLINTMISAFGAPVGPIIAAVLIGLVIGACLMYTYDRAATERAGPGDRQLAEQQSVVALERDEHLQRSLALGDVLGVTAVGVECDLGDRAQVGRVDRGGPRAVALVLSISDRHGFQRIACTANRLDLGAASACAMIA
jgi:hypothetical protein